MERLEEVHLTTFGTERRDRVFVTGFAFAMGLTSGKPQANDFERLRNQWIRRDELKVSGLGHAVTCCKEAGVLSLMLLRDCALCRRWLVQGAKFALDRQLREGGAYSLIALQDTAALGASGDWNALRDYSCQYLESDEGVAGRKGPGGVTPHVQDHYWHFMNMVASYHGIGIDAGRRALGELLAEKPRSQWAHSTTWWNAMCELAKASVLGDAELVRGALAMLGPINAKMWNPADGPAEAGLALMAMGVATIAVHRGLDVRPGPHPSCPTELFYYPMTRVEVRPWTEAPDLEPELVDAIVKAAKNGAPRWQKSKKGATPAKRRAKSTKSTTKTAAKRAKSTAATKKGATTAKKPKG